jgi:hypothetical protein
MCRLVSRMEYVMIQRRWRVVNYQPMTKAGCAHYEIIVTMQLDQDPIDKQMVDEVYKLTSYIKTL